MSDERRPDGEAVSLDAQMDAMARLVGLDIPAAYRRGVRDQLALNQRLIGPLEAFEPATDAVPAPTYEP